MDIGKIQDVYNVTTLDELVTEDAPAELSADDRKALDESEVKVDELVEETV